MKKIVIILIAIICMACKKKEYSKQTVQVATLVDVTDSMLVFPEANTIISRFGLEHNTDTEVIFSIQAMTDKSMNEVQSLYLPDGTTTDKQNTRDIANHRKKVIRAFYAQVAQTIEAFNTKRISDTSLAKSECFTAISQQVARMKKQNADRNTLYLYSDLAENSQIFSVYTKHGQKLLDKNPDSVARLFDKTGLLPNDLSNFDVVCVYAPKTRQDDLLYRRMRQVYERLFLSRNATITFQANN